MRFHLNLLFTILLFIPFTLSSQENTKAIVLTEGTRSLSIRNGTQFFVDKGGELTIDQVVTKDFLSTQGKINFGISHDTIWLAFKVFNTSTKSDWFLEFNTHKFYTLELYRSQDGNIPELTYAYTYEDAFSEREVLEPQLAFKQVISQGSEVSFFLRIRSENSLEIPLVIHSQQAYHVKMTRMKILYGGVYGILISMFFYNLFTFFFLRDKNYLYFTLYVVLYTVYLSALSGLGAKILWPYVQGRWTTIFSAVFGGLSLGVGCYLTREFLQTKLRQPLMDKILKLLALLGILLSVIIFIFKDFTISFIYGNVIGTLILLSIVWIAILSLSKGYRPALFFLLSYSTIIVAQVCYSLLSLGPFGDLFLLKHLNQFAPVLQVMLLSLSLSYRFNIMRKEIDKSQVLALEAETALAEKLELIVQQRTLELREANENLRTLSHQDPQTGLYNRRFFEQTYNTEWKRHGRESLPLSIIMCDIDHFKEYNDAAGHQAGDDCILKISNALDGCARRDSDVIARYGGEEFIIILPQMGEDAVVNVAQSVKDKVDSLKLPHLGIPGQQVTISLGVSTIIPSSAVKPELLIEQADKALYISKETGRNRITYHNERGKK